MSHLESKYNLTEYESDSFGKIHWQPRCLDLENPLAVEYKLEWRRYVAEKNLQHISRSFRTKTDTLKFSLYRRKIINNIFDTCRILNQPPEVRYLALAILDRFMMIHYIQICKTLDKKGNRVDRLRKEVLAKRMTDNAILSVLSAIQLASKYSSTLTALTSVKLHRLFTFPFDNYSATKFDITKSEARVYSAIGYKIPPVTPLTYIEMFFEEFYNEGIKKHLKMTLSSFLNVCIDVLDVALIFHKEIFGSLYRKVTGRVWMVRDSLFVKIEGDYIYLASSVIYAAAKLQDPTGMVSLEFLRYFSFATQYKAEEIECLGTVILTHITNE
ncbi:UNVERIFIED_CONTAM: hypothetical protein PYX00_005047 [Menopon gallinae]|uniref:Uncharacterized protein n=1 Tax=Menopon gallinae TaxID=328185 RepID=A0AAW2HQX2_9NEOP